MLWRRGPSSKSGWSMSRVKRVNEAFNLVRAINFGSTSNLKGFGVGPKFALKVSKEFRLKSSIWVGMARELDPQIHANNQSEKVRGHIRNFEFCTS